jgi:AraC-like DNA-binding protein
MNYFLITSILVGFVFIIASLSSKKGRDKSIIYLNLIILFLTLNYLQIVLLDNVFTHANYFTTMLRIPFYALILPAYYTFVTYYLGIQAKIKSYVFISICLFLIEIIVRFFLFKDYYNDNECYVVAKYRQIEEIVNILFSLFLFVKAFILLFKKQNMYQTILTFDNLKWLKKFMLISTVIMASWLFAVLFNLDKVLNPNMYIFYPLRFSISFLVFWLGYHGLSNYSILTERILIREKIAKTNTLHKIENETESNKNFVIIESHLKDNLCYLNSSYGLEQLAIDLKKSKSSLSHIINNEGNTNFSDLINNMRVEKAKELLSSNDFDNYTIIAIGLECGFNSKSTFYLAFKKFIGITPSEFRSNKNSIVLNNPKVS